VLTIDDVVEDLKGLTGVEVRYFNETFGSVLLWWADLPEDYAIVEKIDELRELGFSQRLLQLIYEGLYCLAHGDEINYHTMYLGLSPVAALLNYRLEPVKEEWKLERRSEKKD
jgi:hypothetical protein